MVKPAKVRVAIGSIPGFATLIIEFMTERDLNEVLKAQGRTHYVIGINKDGKAVRVSQNMTERECKNWESGILKQYYETFKVVKDTI